MQKKAIELSGTLRLNRPLQVNGVEHKELNFDAEGITGRLFTEAQSARQNAGGLQNISFVLEADNAMHLYLGFAAVKVRHPEFDFNDLERLTGKDVILLQRIGRNFIGTASEGSSNQSTSDDYTETTPELLEKAEESWSDES